MSKPQKVDMKMLWGSGRGGIKEKKRKGPEVMGDVGE